MTMPAATQGPVPRATPSQRWLARLSFVLVGAAVVILAVFAGLKSIAMLAVGLGAAAVGLAAEGLNSNRLHTMAPCAPTQSAGPRHDQDWSLSGRRLSCQCGWRPRLRRLRAVGLSNLACLTVPAISSPPWVQNGNPRPNIDQTSRIIRVVCRRLPSLRNIDK